MYLIPFPLVSSLVLFYAFYQTIKGADYWPFYGAVFLFLSCFAGLAYSLFPNLLPNQPYYELAAHPMSLTLVVTACSFLLPLLIGYSLYAYWVFRGKVTDEDALHY